MSLRRFVVLVVLSACSSKGPVGPAGPSPVVAVEPAGANCPYGGVSITSAGVTQYVCGTQSLSNATTSQAGLVVLETPSADVDPSHVVVASDQRLSNARPAASVDFSALASASQLAGTVPVANLPASTAGAAGAIPLAGPGGQLDPSWLPPIASFTGSLAGDVTGSQSATVIGAGLGFGSAGNIRYVVQGARTTPTPDGSAARPFPTLTAASAAVGAGDVLVLSGSFSENVSFGVGVTLIGAGPNATSVNGTLTFTPPNASVELRSLSVTCSASGPCVTFTSAVTSFLRLRQVAITQSSAGAGGAVQVVTGQLDAFDTTIQSWGTGAALGVNSTYNRMTHGNVTSLNGTAIDVAGALVLRDSQVAASATHVGIHIANTGVTSNAQLQAYGSFIGAGTAVSMTDSGIIILHSSTINVYPGGTAGVSGLGTVSVFASNFQVQSGTPDFLASGGALAVASGKNNTSYNNPVLCSGAGCTVGGFTAF